MMLETDLLCTQGINPMMFSGKPKKQISEKRRRRAKWMENAENKSFDYHVLAIHKLRCNVKSLAAEAKTIRHEERRASLMYSGCLRWHRVSELREESRYAQLALAFLRGQRYQDVENNPKKPVDFMRIDKKIKKASHPFYGSSAKILNWLKGEHE